jgi:GxxExxY protein
MKANEITGAVISAAMKVHSVLGPGLLESAYEICLLEELNRRGVRVRSQVPVPIIYETVKLDAGYRLDLLVEETVIIEIKAIEDILPIHRAQVLSYLRLMNKSVALLINFHSLHLREGIVRIVNDYRGDKPGTLTDPTKDTSAHLRDASANLRGEV